MPSNSNRLTTCVDTGQMHGEVLLSKPIPRMPLLESKPKPGGFMKRYAMFGCMVATSTVAMYILMYTNTLEWDHVYLSESRVYMALVMGAAMGAIMLAFMIGMYASRRANIALFIGLAIVFIVALWLMRSQATVHDVAYMKAMIPHHSIAILTSERAHISDARVRKLADEIIESQRREIAEMKMLIDDLQRRR